MQRETIINESINLWYIIILLFLFSSLAMSIVISADASGMAFVKSSNKLSVFGSIFVYIFFSSIGKLAK